MLNMFSDIFMFCNSAFELGNLVLRLNTNAFIIIIIYYIITFIGMPLMCPVQTWQVTVNYLFSNHEILMNIRWELTDCTDEI